MSTFVLKHFPGMRAEEDYSYVSMAQQERTLLHLERDRTERNLRKDDICGKLHTMNLDSIGKLQEHVVSDPISIDSKHQDPDSIEQRRLLDDPARNSYSSAQPEFEFTDDDELPVSTIFTDHYSKSKSNMVGGRSSTVVVTAPPLRVALALDMVPDASRVSVGCSVSAMLQGTAQAWTWFLYLLFPRIHFRGRDLRDSCKPDSQ